MCFRCRSEPSHIRRPQKAGALGVPITSIHNTISGAFGSAYVNNFIQGGRVKRVYAQADAPYRMLPKDIEKLYTGAPALPGWSASTGSRR